MRLLSFFFSSLLSEAGGGILKGCGSILFALFAILALFAYVALNGAVM